MNSLTAVESFSVRLATEEEKQAHQPTGWAWARQKIEASMNTASLALQGGDLLRFFGKPIPKGTPFKILRTLTGWNWYVYASPNMFQTISKEHRHDPQSFFANDMAAQTLLDIGSEIFGEALQPEDTISTCTKENSKKYRMMVARHLGSTELKTRLPEINCLAGKIFDEWDKQSGEVNVTEASQKFVSAVINRFLLALDEEDSLSVAKAIVAANGYMLAKAAGTANKEEFEKHATVLRHAIDKALKNDTPFIRELQQQNLTDIQKKVLIIVVYFTSLGGTISQMGGLMWYLAQNSQYQDELLAEINAVGDNAKKYPFTDKLVDESFRVHPSTLTIDRPVGQPLMVTYNYEDIHQEVYIPEKAILTFFQPWAASRCDNANQFNPHRPDGVNLYPFGHGFHKCVGQFISEQLMGRFTREFTKRFISSTQQAELPIQGYFNLEPKSDVILQVISRN